MPKPKARADRARLARCDRAGSARAVLPAGRSSTATEQIDGFEALAALAAPAEGLDLAEPVRRDRRGQRADRPDRRMGAAHRVPRPRAVADRRARQRSTSRRCSSPIPQLPAIVHQRHRAGGHPPLAARARDHREACSSTTMPKPMRCSPRSSGVGVRLALDDFGTGYSSLGYLKKAPFDKIKIDQSSVRGATQPGSRNGAIIASITSLAHALGMDTTAEGVETLDELDLVRMHGCSHVQGFIYERPLSAEAATERAARPAWPRLPAGRGPRARDARRCCARSCSSNEAGPQRHGAQHLGHRGADRGAVERAGGHGLRDRLAGGRKSPPPRGGATRTGSAWSSPSRSPVRRQRPGSPWRRARTPRPVVRPLPQARPAERAGSGIS